MDADNTPAIMNDGCSGGSNDEGEMQIEALSNSVFGNILLREMILENVLLQRDRLKELVISDTQSLRLVNKAWNGTVSDSFRRNRKPLFSITLTRENSTENGSYVQETGSKLLNEFVTTMNNSCVNACIPTFRLKMMPAFFRRENHDDLSTCLTKCGKGLLDLSMEFPINSTMTFTFQPFLLPKLIKLSVHFSDERLAENSYGLQNNAHAVYPLQSILNAASELQEVHFLHTRSNALIPFGFEYLSLPSAISKLFIDCPVKDSDLGILTKAELHSLTHLRLFAGEVAFKDDLVFQVLNSFRTTLRTLNLRGSRPTSLVRNSQVTFFKFPVMENLSTLTISSPYWELDDTDNQCRPEHALPKLNELRILNQSESCFSKWTANKMFKGVKRLFVSLVERRNQAVQFHQQFEVPLTITADKMQSLHLAFPAVVCLEITVSGPEICGLQYLFLEMTELQKLAITVKGSADLIQPPHWDALLIGAPPDITASFKRNPDFWNYFELKDDTLTSLRKLTQLRSLAIVESQICNGPNQPNSSLISDISFYFTFLRMPNLKQLLLSPRFMPSTNMAERWTSEKGTDILSIPRQSL